LFPIASRFPSSNQPTSFFSFQANTGDSIILCPATGCKIPLDDASLKRLVSNSSDVIDAFRKAETNEFIKAKRRVMKWCPGLNCSKVVYANEGGSQQIDCECGECFCFECAALWHGPLDCEFLKKWLKQFDSDAETFRWINDNTKDCPKCKAPIQKNGGCNYMRCGKCSHEFCWLCLWPWWVVDVHCCDV